MLFCVQHFMNFRRLQIGSTSDKPTSAMDIRIADISAPCRPPLPEDDEPSPSPNLERTGLSVEFELLLKQLVNLHLSEVAQGTQQTSQYFTAATRLILEFFCAWQPVLRCMSFLRFCLLHKQCFVSEVRQRNLLWFLGRYVSYYVACVLHFPLYFAKNWFAPRILLGSVHTVKDKRVSLVEQGAEAVSIHLTQSKSCMHGKSQTLALQSMKKWKSLNELGHLSLGCTFTHFLEHIFASRWHHAKFCLIHVKYEYWMIVWMCVFFELCFSAFFKFKWHITEARHVLE